VKKTVNGRDYLYALSTPFWEFHVIQMSCVETIEREYPLSTPFWEFLHMFFRSSLCTSVVFLFFLLPFGSFYFYNFNLNILGLGLSFFLLPFGSF